MCIRDSLICWLLKIGVALVAGLNPTSHDTSWRQPCTTCLSCPEGKVRLRTCLLYTSLADAKYTKGSALINKWVALAFKSRVWYLRDRKSTRLNSWNNNVPIPIFLINGIIAILCNSAWSNTCLLYTSIKVLPILYVIIPLLVLHKQFYGSLLLAKFWFLFFCCLLYTSCWIGFIVPGSMLIYGSNFWLVTW